MNHAEDLGRLFTRTYAALAPQFDVDAELPAPPEMIEPIMRRILLDGVAQPNLELATTRELLDELRTRGETFDHPKASALGRVARFLRDNMPEELLSRTRRDDGTEVGT